MRHKYICSFQVQRVPSKGRAGAVRQICFSCLSNASSSEAMLLFKPLKELRAKRKGTHLVGLHACAFLSNFLSMRGSYENKSHWKRWKAKTVHLCLAVQYACFGVCVCVTLCLLCFRFTKWVSWNRWPSVELTFCVDSDTPSQILLAETVCHCILVRSHLHSYWTGHHCVYIIFKDANPLFQRWMWFLLRL